MTADHLADRRIAAWLDTMPDEVPDRVIEAVMLAATATPQVRRPILRGPRRFTRMQRPLLLVAAAMLGAAVIGGALLVAGAAPSTPIVDPTLSSSPQPTPTPGLGTLPDGMRGLWLTDSEEPVPQGQEPVPMQLSVALDGRALWVSSATSLQMRSVALESGAPGEVLVRLERATPECPAETLGRYRWAVADNGLHLSLELVEDPCVPRATTLARTWTRSHVGLSTGGPGVVTGVGPLVQVTLPDGLYTTRRLTDAQEVYDKEKDFIFYAFRDPQVFGDPCNLDSRLPWQSGAQAFVNALRRNPGFTDIATTPLEIGGVAALRVTLRARDDYPPCEPEAHAFYEWVPLRDENGSWWLSAGDADEFYLVDHPDATLLLQVLPVGSPLTREIIDSVIFPDDLRATPS